jgi:uroporphyrinogen-III synthase
LRKSGFETFFSLKATTAAELLRLIPKKELENKKFLFPRGDRSLRTIPETLESFAEVLEVIVYRTIEAERDDKEFVQIKKKFEDGKIIAVCFFSPSGVEGFLDRFENFSQGEIKIATIGKTTARSVADNNMRADFVSAKPAAEDFARGLADYLRKEF